MHRSYRSTARGSILLASTLPLRCAVLYEGKVEKQQATKRHVSIQETVLIQAIDSAYFHCYTTVKYSIFINTNATNISDVRGEN